MYYPLLTQPYFRHGSETPWGGDKLKAYFGKPSPDDTTGEALEASALPGMSSLIMNGSLAALTLDKAQEKWGEALSGSQEFPLLLKLLDARETLSVQVHPGDAYAQKRHGKRGKTEAWVVLSCDPGAKIAYGLKSGATLADVENGNMEEALNWVKVAPGDVYYVPHGMVHALGAGVQAYEIQQASDVTYRIWDWGRVGKDGKPRELHLEDAKNVVRPELQLAKIGGATVLCEGGSRTYYDSDENFELCRLNVAGDMPLPEGRMLFLTPLGECELIWGDEVVVMEPLATAVIPAAMKGAMICGNLTALLSSTPDQAALRQELGYRAENVSGLMGPV